MRTNKPSSGLKLWALFFLAWTVTAPCQQVSKEYIYLGNRVIAIEQSGTITGVSSVAPASKVYPPAASVAVLSGSFIVIATGSWTVTEVPNWMTMTSATSGTGTGAVYYTVSLQGGGSSTRSAILRIGTKTFTISQLGTSNPPAAPQSVSVTPNSGSGDVATLEFQSTSPGGGGYIDWMQGLINYGADGRDACHFIYTARDGALLLGDGSGGWVGAGYMGENKRLSSGMCEVDLGASSQRVQDDKMFVRLAIRFQPIFAGTYKIYMLTGDGLGNFDSSGWMERGAWTPFPAPAPPTVISSSPVSGTGTRKLFSYQLGSALGPKYIRQGLGLLSPALDGNTGCYLGFHRSSNMFYLNGQTGFGGASGGAGQSGSIESLRCRLHLSTSSIVESGSSLIVTFDVEFLPSMSGTIANWVYPVDRPDQTTGWQNRGSWVIGTAPTGGLVSHWKGEGNTSDTSGGNPGNWFGVAGYDSGALGQSFKFTNPNSRVRISSSATVAAQRTISAWVKFTAFTGRAIPIVTVGGPLGGADWVGISTTGSQCGEYRLSFDHWGSASICGATRLSPGVWTHVAHTYDGTTSRLYVNGVENGLGIVPTYTPPLNSMDIGGNTTTEGGAVLVAPSFPGGIDEVRYYDLPLSAAEIMNIYTSTPPPATATGAVSATSTPVAANGSTIFTFTFGGGISARGGRVLIGQPDINGSQACFLFLDPVVVPPTVALVNDSGSGSTSGSIGGGGTLTNSICEVNRANASVVSSGGNWIFTIPVRFLPIYRGTQRIFMLGHDGSGNPSLEGWKDMGAITPFPAPPPATVTVSPNSGTGPSRKFTYTVAVGTDGNFIRNGQILIGDVLNGTTGCAVAYDVLTRLFTMNPYGSPAPQGVAGNTGTLSGPKCSMNLANSSITATATTLVVEVDLTFAGTFLGAKNNYAYVIDRAGQTTDWNVIGAWSPGTQVLMLSPPEQFSVSVNQPRSFTASCASGGTLTDLGWSVLPAGSSNQPVAGTNPASITASSVPVSGVLTVTASGRCGGAGTPLLTAQGTMYMYYYQNPVGPFVSPNSGSGTIQQFLTHWSIQPNNGGIVDSDPVQFLFGADTSSANSRCYLMFWQNTISLRKDTLDEWAPVQPNGGYPPLPGQPNTSSSYSVENSQCKMSWTNSYTTTDAINRYVNMNLLFKPAFSGAKGIFGRRSDSGAATATGFTQLGSWMVPQ